MERVAPVGPMYQAGTLSGNPLAMTAGIETLKFLRQPGVFEEVVTRTNRLGVGVGEAAKSAGVPIYQTRVGSMFCTFFTEGPVTNWATVSQSDTQRFGRFFQAMLERGVYLAPSQFEAGFTSTAHTDDVIESTIGAAYDGFRAIV
jgi:glutamate-1-semialdehyde 2,1-aminomutase